MKNLLIAFALFCIPCIAPAQGLDHVGAQEAFDMDVLGVFEGSFTPHFGPAPGDEFYLAIGIAEGWSVDAPIQAAGARVKDSGYEYGAGYWHYRENWRNSGKDVLLVDFAAFDMVGCVTYEYLDNGCIVVCYSGVYFCSQAFGCFESKIVID